MSHRRFELHRDTDHTGVSGTGIVAEGIAFTDGTVALRWKSEWPTSVVFHDRGVEAVQKIHGHGGATRIVWLDVPRPPPVDWVGMWNELTGYVDEALNNPKDDDAADIRRVMKDLRRQYGQPVADWMKAICDPAVNPAHLSTADCLPTEKEHQ
jgi:hypothetical protein